MNILKPIFPPSYLLPRWKYPHCRTSFCQSGHRRSMSLQVFATHFSGKFLLFGLGSFRDHWLFRKTVFAKPRMGHMVWCSKCSHENRFRKHHFVRTRWFCISEKTEPAWNMTVQTQLENVLTSCFRETFVGLIAVLISSKLECWNT